MELILKNILKAFENLNHVEPHPVPGWLVGSGGAGGEGEEVGEGEEGVGAHTGQTPQPSV